jgi:lysyl-tRNA synthetase class 1
MCPTGDMLAEHLGKPLTRIPDPFGKFESFAHHNNAMLREFLDRSASNMNLSRRPPCMKAARLTRR